MRKTLFILLLSPVIVSAQKMGININGLYVPPAKTTLLATTTKGSPLGGNLRAFVSSGHIDIGVAMELAGYNTKGKILKTSIDPKYGEWKKSTLHTIGYYTGPSIYFNTKFKLGPGVKLFCGAAMGFILPDNSKTKTSMSLLSFNTYPGDHIDVNNKDGSKMYGLQAGILVRLVRGLWLNAEADYRTVTVKTTTGNITSSIDGSSSNIVYGQSVKYRISYFPIALGIRYTF